MPKQALPINQFHGGLNTNADPRDIAPNELAAATDVQVDKVGRIVPMGSFQTHDTVDSNTATNSAGRGLLQWSHDRLEGEAAGTSAAETGDDYLALTDGATNTVDIWSKLTDTWGLAKIDLREGSETGIVPCMYQADGAIRVCDGLFTNTSVSKWYGYIDRTVFADANNATLVLNGWYSEDQEIKAGTHSSLNQAENTYTGPGDDYPAEPVPANADANGYVSLGVSSLILDNGGMRGFKNYYYSLIYDGMQESQLFQIGTTHDVTWENSRKRYRLYVAPDSFDGAPFGKRVTGLKVYWKKVDTNSTIVGSDDAYLLLVADFVSGVKSPLGTDYVAWVNHGSNAAKNTSLIEFTDEPRGQTYRSETGFSESEISISARYKCAVVTNRVTYIGNIFAKSKDSPTAVVQGDAMIKSPVNQFDSFPTSRTLEVVVRDGDVIIHLEEYADRLLQFKKNRLYIINISQEIEFLEAELKHKGVNSPGSVAKTDMGIVWANKHGVFLYDGQQVVNLLEKGGIKMISDSEWDSFLPVDKDPMVGYIPNKRQVIVADAVDADGDGSFYLFDFVTQSWVKSSAAKITDAVKSNFANDWDGELIYHSATATYQWNSASAASAGVDLKTKDIDFGQPGVRKKIYKVYISYRGNATNVQVHYGVDGLAPALTFNNITSGTDGSTTGAGSNAKCIPYDAGTTDWLKAELKPSVSINNINSFRLKLSGDGSNTIHADFEINDITIIYRGKNVK